MIPRYSMIPSYSMTPGIRWSIRSMDFDNRKVYGDTSITDGLVLLSSGCSSNHKSLRGITYPSTPVPLFAHIKQYRHITIIPLRLLWATVELNQKANFQNIYKQAIYLALAFQTISKISLNFSFSPQIAWGDISLNLKLTRVISVIFSLYWETFKFPLRCRRA